MSKPKYIESLQLASGSVFQIVASPETGEALGQRFRAKGFDAHFFPMCGLGPLGMIVLSPELGDHERPNIEAILDEWRQTHPCSVFEP
jgi:hypothetical protein